MTVSRLTASIARRGLALARTLALPVAICGCSSVGVLDTPTLVSGIDELTDAFGYGPAISLAAKVLREAGGPILLSRVATGTAGQLGAYAQEGAGSAAAGTLSADGSNTSTAIPALTGTAVDPYAVRIKCTTGGANIAANPVVQVSLDGGLTWYAADAVDVSATPTAIGDTGLLLAWTDGTFVLNDFWLAVGAACPTTGDATGLSVLSLSGTPVDTYDVRIEITRSATTPSTGTGALRYSLDAGETWAPEQPVPGSGVVLLGDSGVTATFSAATLVDGDIYRFKTLAPVFTASALATTLAAFEEVTTPDHEGVIIVGAIDATFFDEVEASHDRLIAASKPRWFLSHARDQGAAIQGETASAWVTALIGATPGFAGANADFIVVCAGAALVTDPINDASMRRSSLHAIAPRVVAIDVAEHPGRVRSGKLALDELVHDLAASSLAALDAQGFMGAQSIQGVEGAYATDRTRAASGGDFTQFMRVRVMCFAARAAIARFAEEVNETIPVNPDGTIRADVADGLDKALTSYMRRELGARVSEVEVAVDRSVNLITTPTLPFDLSLVPLAYATAISLRLAFTLRSV